MSKKHLIRTKALLTATLLLALMCGCDDSSQQSARTESSGARANRSETAQEAFREGSRLGKSGDYKGAIAAYSKAIELDAAYREAYSFRAFTYLLLDNFEAAMNDFDIIVAMDPSAASYRSRADAYMRSGYSEKAIVDYNKSLELNPDDATGYRNRAAAHRELNTLESAIADITKAIELEPKNPMWLYERAVIEVKQGNLDAALTDAESAIGLASSGSEFRPGEDPRADAFRLSCQGLIAQIKGERAKRFR